ncbi:sugar phosphate isomerase/epimerase family protein [Testudinibacter aquarius]|uniref:Sugar phosphate isomerase/epimerase n=1 Tax=Testudinibacter aquarius TaxID=1524974 RepID=A0A4R3YBR6_9PAST|nr:TIM barrel protein [Testudinibacter aquarius]KAE9529369.1 xylose isomerase [Testudinibacter aquarius]TCV89885.1 sugar phosphate isomerase/epimerase [Testudinibacter aquarius]TNG93741.1 sugar phosphate isomerase/epimerase [Testudinibacter aquarius]
MDNKLTLSVNTSIYDGYDLETTLASIKKCGFDHFELAYNQGYVGNLNQNLFSVENANMVNNLKHKYALSTLALGCTMDLSTDGLFDIFSSRLHFAQLIGAKYINVCTTKLENKQKMLENLKFLRPLLEETGCVLCLENGGDYNFDAFITLEDGVTLLDILGKDIYALNFDPGNMFTYNKELNLNSQSVNSLAYSQYFHIKDVVILEDKFVFTPIGDGVINYQYIIQILKQKNIPCSLEIPLRMYRDLDSTPRRKENKVDINLIEETLIKSREYIENI